MEIVNDYRGNLLEIGDSITYLGILGRSPVFKEGKITQIDLKRRNGDIVEVLGVDNLRTGWTYPYRIIKNEK